ncbi:MAG: hypothetical protein LBR36_02350 [Bacteroidales bacterium]|jgi:DNA mismatch repair ATPase MutS|nr:hypothetical protein [Bacteroidales bacterium]
MNNNPSLEKTSDHFTIAEMISGKIPFICTTQITDFQYIIENLPLQSTLSKRYLFSQKYMREPQKIENELNNIDFVLRWKQNNVQKAEKINFLLSQFRDIEKTFQNLHNNLILNDIDFFEIKNFAFLTQEIHILCQDIPFFKIANLDKIVILLDPQNTHSQGFYIYDDYSSELAILRKQMRENSQNDTDLITQCIEIEDNIRIKLSQNLQPFAEKLLQNSAQIAYLDILFAKAHQINDLQLCRPQTAVEKTVYQKIFNPLIKNILQSKSKEYQPIDIELENAPILLTGINMGGKTVLLRTLALCQTLYQFGFFVPSRSACIVPKDGLRLSMEDNVNATSGLSSFALEIKRLSSILDEINEGKSLLVLLDEPARSTNPEEGRAIVMAVLKILAEKHVNSCVTTHYDCINIAAKQLRVKGLKDTHNSHSINDLLNNIDYSLTETKEINAPHEALSIAKLLNINKELLSIAEEILSIEK